MSEDSTASLTVEILKDIRQGVQDLRTDTNHRFERMERTTIAGFAGVHERLERVDSRLEGMRDLFGEHWRDHEARIRALEARSSTG